MQTVLTQTFHIAIMIIILGFGVSMLFGMSGSFDQWNKRTKRN